MKNCPNCKANFEKVKDRYYQHAVAHQTAGCPYQFYVAAKTVKQLQTNVSKVLHNFGFSTK
jgi:hydrogenase maturation factor HypF (carbamoyltransferase family)